jgi:hypothetical protein
MVDSEDDRRPEEVMEKKRAAAWTGAALKGLRTQNLELRTQNANVKPW